MGTSQSSDGSPSGVPMVPPWVPPPPVGDPDTPSAPPSQPPEDQGTGVEAPEAEPGSGGTLKPPSPSPPSPIAPAGRFGPARRSLGGFASTGDSRALRRGLGHYVRKGYGGAATAVRRFGGTISGASSLYSALSPGAPGTAEAEALKGRAASAVLDALVDAVKPVDGSLDAESSRSALRDALSDLLERYPQAELNDLSDEQRLFAIERYVACDVFRRLQLDIGKHIQEKAPSAATAVSRLRQVRDYVKQAVAAAFRRIADAGRDITSRNVAAVVRDALRETFGVFEGYAQ